jgi:hypothetical protein
MRIEEAARLNASADANTSGWEELNILNKFGISQYYS